jgi:hypothetical protein
MECLPPLTGGRQKVFQIISVWTCVCRLMEDGMPPLIGGIDIEVKATHPRKCPQIISVWSCVCQLMEVGGRSVTA